MADLLAKSVLCKIGKCIVIGDKTLEFLQFWGMFLSGVNGKLVYRISCRLDRNDEIRKEYLRTGY